MKNATEEGSVLLNLTNQTILAGDKLKQFKERLQNLKEQIARARDVVQRVGQVLFLGILLVQSSTEEWSIFYFRFVMALTVQLIFQIYICF